MPWVLDRLAQRNVFASPLSSLAWTMTRLRGGANSEGNSHLATGAAYLWLDDPSSCDAPVQKAGSRGAAHPPEALARVHPFAMAHTPLKMSIDESA